MTAFARVFGEEFDKFRLGQIFFISGVTFGLFLGDGFRKILFIAALLCLSKMQIKEKFYESWTHGQKLAGKFLLVFCAWALFVPLIFGIEPIAGRLEGIFRPIELFIIMWETVIFARDAFFFNNIKKFAIATCLIYSVLALGQRFTLGFAVNFNNWIITELAWRVGTLLSGLSPWVIYAFLTEKSRNKTVFCGACAILTWGTMFLTMFTTFWLVMIVQIAAILVVTAALYRTGFKRICLLMITAAAVGGCAIYGIAAKYDNGGGFAKEWEQITSVGSKFDLNKFTNKRDEKWRLAVEWTAKRPVFGYGWADGDFVNKDLGHMHNALLQAVWNIGWPGAIMYVALVALAGLSALRALWRSRTLAPVPFIILIAFLAYSVCGVLDDMFRSQRTIMTLYLSVFMLMLSPLAAYLPQNEKNVRS